MHKKAISLILAVLIMLSVMPAAFADGTQTVNDAPDLMELVGPTREGPIFITKAVLTRNGVSEDIYLLMLAGVKSPLINPNNIASCLLSAVSLCSPYLSRVMSLCRQHIPKGSKIVIAAHSLGGMVGQLFASDISMKARYEILNITAFGSPLVNTLCREGELHRLLDVSDPLWKLSMTGLRNLTNAAAYEDGGYRQLSVDAHTQSYRQKNVWGEYDCFGVKGGNAVISYDPDDVFCYRYSPHTLVLF